MTRWWRRLRDGTRAEQVQRIETDLLEQYRDPTLVTKPALLEQRGGAYYSEAAVALLASLLGVSSRPHATSPMCAMTARSRSCADDAVIETTCDVTSAGAKLSAPPPSRRRSSR